MSTYIPVVIFVSSCIDSLLIVRSLVFPRESSAMETLKLLLGVVIECLGFLLFGVITCANYQ